MLLTRKTRLAACCSWRWRVVFGVLCVLVVGLLVATAGVAPAAGQDTTPVAAEEAPPAPPAATPKADAKATASTPHEKPQAIAVPASDAPPAVSASEAPAADETAKKAPPTGSRRGTIVYSIFWAPPDHLDRVVSLLKHVAPAAQIELSKINVLVVVTATREDHERIRGAIGELQSLLARPANALLAPRQPALMSRRSLPPLPPATESRPMLTPSIEPASTPPAAPTAPGASPLRPAEPRNAQPSVVWQVPAPAAFAADVALPVPVARPPAPGTRLAALGPDLGMGRPAAEGSQLDLVSLANSYTDATANLRMASLHHTRLQQLQKSAAVSNEEVEIAAIKLDAAERKVDLLRSIAQSALRTSEMELQVLHQLHKAGTQPSGVGPLQLEIPRVEGRLEILKRILESPGPGKTPTKY